MALQSKNQNDNTIDRLYSNASGVLIVAQMFKSPRDLCTYGYYRDRVSLSLKIVWISE